LKSGQVVSFSELQNIADRLDGIACY